MLGQDRFIVRQCNRGHCKQAALFTEKEISPPHKLMSARLVPRPSACHSVIPVAPVWSFSVAI